MKSRLHSATPTSTHDFLLWMFRILADDNQRLEISSVSSIESREPQRVSSVPNGSFGFDFSIQTCTIGEGVTTGESSIFPSRTIGWAVGLMSDPMGLIDPVANDRF